MLSLSIDEKFSAVILVFALIFLGLNIHGCTNYGMYGIRLPTAAGYFCYRALLRGS